MPACARPVRTLPRSAFSASSDFCIFCSAVLRISGMFGAVAIACPSSLSAIDVGAFVLAQDDALHRAGLEDAEHADRQLLVAAQRERGGVHDAQIAGERLVERQPVVT